MKFPSRCLIHKVHPTGEVLIKDGRIVAFNGALIVQVPFHGAGPDNVTVATKDFSHCFRGRGKRDPQAVLEWKENALTAIAGDGSRLSLDAQRNLSYPSLDELQEPNEFLTVRFSSVQLAAAAAAMGTDVVELRIARDEYVVARPLVIRPCDGGRDGDVPLEGARAVLGVST